MVDVGPKLRVLACGSRAFTDVDGFSIERRLARLRRDYPHLKPSQILIITGGARGADSQADFYARMLRYSRKVMPANWERDGRDAGLRRNIAMLDESPDLVLAFWDGKSRGTAHTIREAQKRGIPVEVISPSPA